MANLFNITTTSSSVTLDAQRTGKVAFTVTNISAAAVRARARIAFPDTSTIPWFTVDGESERVLAPAGTTLYTVRIAVPPTATPKDYTFSLLVVDQSNPDENFTEGPGVKLTVPPLPDKIPEKKPFPWWIVAVAAAALVVVIIVIGLIVNGNNQANANATATRNAVNTATTVANSIATQTAAAIQTQTAEANAHATQTAEANAHATQTAVVAFACKPVPQSVSGHFSVNTGAFLVTGNAVLVVPLPQANHQGQYSLPAGEVLAPSKLGGLPACIKWTDLQFVCDRSAWTTGGGQVTTVLGACTSKLPPGVVSANLTNVESFPVVIQ